MQELGYYILIGLFLLNVGCQESKQIKYTSKTDRNSEYLVVLLGGQSNMVGAGNPDEVKGQRFNNISYYNYGMSPELQVQQNSLGPEFGISKELIKNFPDKNFILIKYAVGASSLYDWSPVYDKDKAEITGNPRFGNLYDSLLVKVRAITEGLNTKIIALAWMQGERDARIPEAGANYYNNFKMLIDSVRNDLDLPDLPVIYGKVNPPKSRYPAYDIVRASQEQINRDVINTYLIDTSDLEKLQDSVHYSTNGQLKLGQRFGEKLAELLKNKHN